jgi:hypothetical protein
MGLVPGSGTFCSVARRAAPTVLTVCMRAPGPIPLHLSGLPDRTQGGHWPCYEPEALDAAARGHAWRRTADDAASSKTAHLKPAQQLPRRIAARSVECSPVSCPARAVPIQESHLSAADHSLGDVRNSNARSAKRHLPHPTSPPSPARCPLHTRPLALPPRHPRPRETCTPAHPDPVAALDTDPARWSTSRRNSPSPDGCPPAPRASAARYHPRPFFPAGRMRP